MQELTQALDEMKGLYQRVVGQPPPTLDPHAYAPFPAGVDPIRHARLEAQQMKEVVDRVRPSPSWMPPTDCFLRAEEFLARIELTGVKREDLEVFVVAGECVVRGERKAPDFGKLRPLAIERPWGRFERRFALPLGCRVDALRARLEDGVLEVTVPVDALEGPKQQRVEVA